MKKFLMFLLIGVLFIASSCSKEVDTKKALVKFSDYSASLKQYTLKGNMEIARKSDSAKFMVEVDYLSPSYYKVTLDNEQNNNRQIIIKNDEGVYVLTPALNKIFKFDSNWPMNSSHSYLLDSLCKDIANDETSSVTLEGNELVIKSKVLHKTNKNLSYQKIYVDSKTYQLKRVVVYDAQDNWQIKLDVTSFNTQTNHTKEFFDVNQTLDDNVSYLSDGFVSSVSGELNVSYVIEGSELESSSSTNDLTIMCYSGEKSYTIITKKVEPSSVATVVRIYEDFEVFSEGIAVFSDNSMSYLNLDLEVMIISDSLLPEELLNIAQSLSWE